MLISQVHVVAREWGSKRDTTPFDNVRHAQHTTKNVPGLAVAIGSQNPAVRWQDLSEHRDVAPEDHISANAKCPKCAERSARIDSTRQRAAQGRDHRTEGDSGVAKH